MSKMLPDLAVMATAARATRGCSHAADTPAQSRAPVSSSPTASNSRTVVGIGLGSSVSPRVRNDDSIATFKATLQAVSEQTGTRLAPLEAAVGDLQEQLAKWGVAASNGLADLETEFGSLRQEVKRL